MHYLPPFSQTAPKGPSLGSPKRMRLAHKTAPKWPCLPIPPKVGSEAKWPPALGSLTRLGGSGSQNQRPYVRRGGAASSKQGTYQRITAKTIHAIMIDFSITCSLQKMMNLISKYNNRMGSVSLEEIFPKVKTKHFGQSTSLQSATAHQRPSPLDRQKEKGSLGNQRENPTKASQIKQPPLRNHMKQFEKFTLIQTSKITFKFHEMSSFKRLLD